MQFISFVYCYDREHCVSCNEFRSRTTTNRRVLHFVISSTSSCRISCLHSRWHNCIVYYRWVPFNLVVSAMIQVYEKIPFNPVNQALTAKPIQRFC